MNGFSNVMDGNAQAAKSPSMMSPTICRFPGPHYRYAMSGPITGIFLTAE